MSEYLLEVKELKKYFTTKGGFLSGPKRVVKAVDGVSFQIKEGEILGIVGESGCGKSTLGRTILRLVEADSGEILFDGTDIRALSREEMRQMRSKKQMIFQAPGASLKPRKTGGEQIREPLELFQPELTGEAQLEQIYRLMDMVGIDRSYLSRFPHEFSGGQRQRIGIARALAAHPKLVICDEPVSALDVSVRAQVLNLINSLKDRFHLTYIFISHDLSVVHHICNRVAVMYLGRIVELADKDALYAKPLHPYTRALLSAIPLPNPTSHRDRVILQGDVPNPANPPAGCHFHLRCPYAAQCCAEQAPVLTEVEPGHYVSCHRVLSGELPQPVSYVAAAQTGEP